MIRLPYLVLQCFYTDQRGRLHRRQVSAFVGYLRRHSLRRMDCVIGHLADDGLHVAVKQVANLPKEKPEEFLAACAVAIEAARSALAREHFGEWLALTRQLADAIAGATPLTARIGMLLSGRRTSTVRLQLLDMLRT